VDAPTLPQEHAGRPVLVGYSGGLDSTVLLHVLARDPARRAHGLRAIHVHHGLHPDADAWEAHCRATCAALGIGCIVARVQVPTSSGDGPEAAARRARRGAFADALRDGEVLALAHHRDDQAETFLLRALRASGPDGLAAMRPWRDFGRGWLWRPLLNASRDALLADAQAHRLGWIEDPSNASDAFERNFLRQRLMPLLRSRWPHAGAALARSAALQAEALELLEAGDGPALASIRTIDPQVVSVRTLESLPAARRARVLRRWIDALGLPPLPARGVAQIEADLLQAAGDGDARFDWAGASIRRWRDLLHAGPRREPLPGDWRVEWDGEMAAGLPTGDTLAFTRAMDTPPDRDIGAPPDHRPHPGTTPSSRQPAPLVLHARRGGERITLPDRSHSHALKHVLQDLGVPPWERERLPLVSNHDGTLLAAGDLVYSAGFDAWLRERGARLIWTRV